MRWVPLAGNVTPRKISTAEGGVADRESGSSTNAGTRVFAYIVSGIVVWSLIGWGVGSLLNLPWLVLIGALLGLAGGLYLSFAPRFNPASSAQESTGSDEAALSKHPDHSENHG